MVHDFGFGIEEEHQIVDPASGELRSENERLPLAQAVAGGCVQPELNQAQIETATVICRTLDDAT